MPRESRVLRRRFESVCRAELSRLRRKTSHLPDDERALVDAITLAVTGAIASRLGEAIRREVAPDARALIVRLLAGGEPGPATPPGPRGAPAA